VGGTLTSVQGKVAATCWSGSKGALRQTPPLPRTRGTLPKVGRFRFNITDKVIIISVCTTDINRRCQTHKEIIVASLKGGEGGRKAKRSFYIVYSREPTATIKGSLRAEKRSGRSIYHREYDFRKPATARIKCSTDSTPIRWRRIQWTRETRLIKFS